ncbi:hypothetical protein L1077_14995 [Pseudoalteromonas luteoviolacea]|uniref:hypothetical protein n=1 Tax=Pseudoalteromonas luteoviolacea TaxID=43657 RepID=UPI001F18F18E|nr:hypothetical protein [Pseudoalteromonas luteoviolacea]MCF6440741.1 hypothetical protein [Pseudoalteromonas luteoviolacea]
MNPDYEEIRGVCCMLVRERGKFFVNYDSGAHGSGVTVKEITEQDFNAVKSGKLKIENIVDKYRFQ